MLSVFNNFYFLVAVKLLIGLLSLSFVINISGKGNLAPSNASDQIQNYVLGGVIGGTIYNSAITILQYILILLIWCIVILSLKWIKTNNHAIGQLLDGQPPGHRESREAERQELPPRGSHRARSLL